MRWAKIIGRPVTKGRPRLGRRRKAYTPARTVEYERLVGHSWNSSNPDEPPFDGPVGMRIIVHSDGVQVEVWELEESYRPKYVTGDIDNYAKAVSDGLNKLAYLDDKQVHHLEIFFTKEEFDD